MNFQLKLDNMILGKKPELTRFSNKVLMPRGKKYSLIFSNTEILLLGLRIWQGSGKSWANEV